MEKSPLNLLIIGGYGAFGGRLARLLSTERRLKLMIAGRSLRKAKNFTQQFPAAKMEAVCFDRNGDIDAQLAALAPDVIVDASGPYQAYGHQPYRVAESAIAIGAHYLDLADGTAFVLNIASLDSAAKDNSVYAMAGVSTCPVLTTAVVRSLSTDLTCIDSVYGGISPSPHAGMGKSVVRAIAGYAGKPLEIVKNGVTHQKHSFVSTRRFTIAPPGEIPLPPLTFSLLDVPDLKLLAELPMPAANTWFGVATRPAIYHFLLRLLSRGVKHGLLSTIAPISGLMHFVMNRFSWGTHRGGMFIALTGVDQTGKRVQRSWHLVAEGDHGPDVPTLAIIAILQKQLDGFVPEPGARTAIDELTLDDYEPMFAELGIKTGTVTESSQGNKGLFSHLLKNAESLLPVPVRKFHSAASGAKFSGHANIQRGNSILSKITGWFIGMPDAGNNVPVTVTIDHANEHEIWTRDFSGQTFSSVMSNGKRAFDGLICERFGPTKVGMALVRDENKLRYVGQRWSFLGIPMPRWLLPVGEAYETSENDEFIFHVEIVMPIVGHVATYHGKLHVH